jgi:hypothetical protein
MFPMKRLTIQLADALYDELIVAAADTVELDETDLAQPAPEQFAAECVESILASRRLERMMTA